MNLFNTLVPRIGAGRLGGLRPVAFGPLRRFVLRVAAEFEDVPLRDADVFDQHPGRVREVFGLRAAKFLGQSFYGVFKPGVRVAAFEKFNDVLAKSVAGILRHESSASLDSNLSAPDSGRGKLPHPSRHLSGIITRWAAGEFLDRASLFRLAQ